MNEIMTLEPRFEFHVQIFSRCEWKSKHVVSDLVEAEELCTQLALRTLDRCRVLRIDYTPIKIFCYAR